MATGSRRYFSYTADDGSTYGMNIDESTYETAALGFGVLDVTAPTYSGLLAVSSTRPLSPRYFNMVGTDADGRQVRRVVLVGSASSQAWQNPQTFTLNLLTVSGNAATATVFTVSSAIGERRVFIPAQDTGLIDGDVDDNQAAGPAPE